MPIFCHLCGTKNDDDSKFCNDCGTPLRAKSVAPVGPESAAAARANPAADNAIRLPFSTPPSSHAPINKRKVAIWAGISFATLVVIGGVSAWLLAAPVANLTNLSTAYGQAIAKGWGPTRDSICVANGVPYDRPEINVLADNTSALSLMANLVTAGLYAVGGESSSGGWYPQPVRVFKSTPALAQWVDKGRLCIAKSTQFVSLSDIGPLETEMIGSKTISSVHAQAKWALKDPAPWLSQAPFAGTLVDALAASQGERWTLDGATAVLQKKEVFRLADKQWVAGKDLQSKVQAFAQSEGPASRQTGKSADSGSKKGLGDWLSSLFSFGGSPLTGKWTLDLDAMDGGTGGMGRNFLKNAGLDLSITFTADAMQAQGSKVKAKFEVDGNKVTVYPQDAPGQGLVFTVIDAGTIELNSGMFAIRYKRVN